MKFVSVTDRKGAQLAQEYAKLVGSPWQAHNQRGNDANASALKVDY